MEETRTQSTETRVSTTARADLKKIRKKKIKARSEAYEVIRARAFRELSYDGKSLFSFARHISFVEIPLPTSSSRQ